MKTILVTGGYGFIGSNFIRYMHGKYPDKYLINLDKITYAGNPDNLSDIIDSNRYLFLKGDITDFSFVSNIFSQYQIDAVVHFAAETHVDRSISGPSVFITTNVLGTQILLEASLRSWKESFENKRFIHISTDEVYGTLGSTGYFTEDTPIAPNSPYSASKAGSDLLVRSYIHTYGFPACITRCSNNYGPYQFPEKLIPLMITNVLEKKSLPVYGDGKNIRDWLHVKDHCSAVDAVLQKGKIGEVYNIGGSNEWMNIDIVKKLLSSLGASEDLIVYVKDRLGHDRRYAIDSSKIRNHIGWEPSIDFEDGLEQTIKWYKDNGEWWRKIMSRNISNHK